MKRRLICTLLCLALLVCLCPALAQASDEVRSGSCGKGVRWSLDSDGLLTISGRGAMDTYMNSFHWADDVTALVIESGVTSVDSFAFQTQKALDEVGDKIDAADKSQVEADLAKLKELVDKHQQAEEMTDSDVAEMKAAQEKLQESAQKVFAKMYEQAQAAQGGAGPDMSGMGGMGPDMGAGNSSSGDDDVVDADFKEV